MAVKEEVEEKEKEEEEEEPLKRNQTAKLGVILTFGVGFVAFVVAKSRKKVIK